MKYYIGNLKWVGLEPLIGVFAVFGNILTNNDHFRGAFHRPLKSNKSANIYFNKEKL
jgi:hypothetical protein